MSNRNKQKGTQHETSIARYLAEQLDDDRIERRALEGNNDRGDIAGVRFRGHRVVIECKNSGGRLQPPQWTKEAQQEAANDGALVGLVVAKRQGTTKPGEQWVLCTVDDLVAMLTATDKEK